MNKQLDHFSQRCLERGITSIPGDVLRKNIERAIRDGRTDLVEMVFHVDRISSIWRFRVTEGYFYAVVGRHTKLCITLYNQDLMRRVRRSRRGHLKHRGKRIRSVK